MCRLMHDQLQITIAGPRGFDETATACSQAPGTPGTHPESITNAAEPDDDASIATDLAEFTRPENLLGNLDLKRLRSKRIILRRLSDGEIGPRGSINNFAVQIFSPRHTNVGGGIRGFKHSRRSMFHSEIMTLPRDTDAR